MKRICGEMAEQERFRLESGTRLEFVNIYWPLIAFGWLAIEQWVKNASLKVGNAVVYNK